MSYIPKTYRKDGGDTHVIADGGKLLIESGGVLEFDGTQVTSTQVQELTVSGAILDGVQSVELNSTADEIVAATLADASAHQGLFVVKNTSASGTKAHTVTITTGTWDGTNKVITLNAPKECIAVFFDSAGNGTLLENVGEVALS